MAEGGLLSSLARPVPLGAKSAATGALAKPVSTDPSLRPVFIREGRANLALAEMRR